jgi:hypothetical protein
MRVLAVDLNRFRSMLGSGEEAFCAKALRAIPDGAAKNPELLREWKRAVTGLVLGLPGEALAAKDPFDTGTVTKATPGLSLAFASLLEGYAEAGLGGELSGEVPEELRRRPLFGLEADGDLVRWGALGRESTISLPLIESIRAKGVDAVGLSASPADP